MSEPGDEQHARLVARKLEAGLSDATPEERLEYLRDLRASWRDAEAGVTRRLLLLVVLGGLGALSMSNALGEMTLAGVRIEDTSLVPAVIPVLIAYVLYELAVAIAAIDLYGEAHAAVFRRVHPTMSRNRLDDLLTPATSIVWSSPGAAWFEDFGRLRWPLETNVSGVVWVGRTMGALVVPPLFLVAYYWQLFADGVTPAAVVSLVLTVVLVVAAAVNTIGWIRGR